jgi:hypothetical protein
MLPSQNRDLRPERAPLVGGIVPELECDGRESESQQTADLLRIVEQDEDTKRGDEK